MKNITEGTSQGLFVVVAIIIFGIFIGLSYTLFGSEGLSNDLEGIFKKSTEQAEYALDLKGKLPTDAKYFSFNEDTKTLISYSGSEKDIIIPQTINEIKVEHIGTRFNSLEAGGTATVKLDSVVIPNTVKTIGFWAFAGNNLKSVTFPNSIKEINGGSFQHNPIETVVLPNNLETLGQWSFGGTELKSITVPNTVTSLGIQFVIQNNNMKSINIPISLKEQVLETPQILTYSNKALSPTEFYDIVYYPDDYIHYYN